MIKSTLFAALAACLLLTGCGIHPSVYKEKNLAQQALRMQYGHSGIETGVGEKQAFNGRYTGNFEKGLYHGEGTFTWNSGHQYTGSYVNGRMQGDGTFTWPDGSKYTGPFRSGKRDGEGSISWSDGRIFKGKFISGKLVGPGTIRLRQGQKLTGQFRQVSGAADSADIASPTKGIILFADKTSFEGKIVNYQPGLSGLYLTAKGSLRNGKGTCTTDRGTEPCKFERGQRVDELYLVRMERATLEAKAEHQRIARGGRSDIDSSRIPEPIHDNSGQYMCPYTQDGATAQWCDMGITTKSSGNGIGASLGQSAGQYVGKKVAEKALEQIPGVGGLLGSFVGSKVGKKLGQAATQKTGVEAAGGMDNIRMTSDLSFSSLQDLSLYLYGNYSNHPSYQEALQLTMEIYPQLQRTYYNAISALQPAGAVNAKAHEVLLQMR